MISFEEKIRIIDRARHDYITFDEEFKTYIASGNSFNGAYNFFSIADVEKHKELTIKRLELDAWKILHGSYRDSSPAKLLRHSIIKKLETLHESISNPT